MTFTYHGTVLITSAAGHHVKIDNVRLWETVQYAEEPKGEHEICYWRGTARVPGLVYRLLDVLGERVTVRLADGRTGKAYITGEAVDSAWEIQIQGIGQPPQ